MATVEELVIQIKADTKGLTTELNGIKSKLNRGFDQKPVNRFGSSVKGLIAPLAGVLAGISAIGALKSIARVGMEFEDLKDSLNTVFGSMAAGDKAMSQIIEFAQTTPFQVEDVTKAFIALKSAGIEPTKDMLQTFADTASVSIDQLGIFEALVRITQRSASGGLGLEELNQIMDRGVDVLGILNRELGLSKDEIAKFGATADGARIIMSALTKGLNEQFGGAMASKMDNLSTKLTNTEIAFKGLSDAIFTGGFGDMLKDTADYFAEIAASATTIVQAANANVSTETIGLVNQGGSPTEVLASAVGDIRKAIQAEIRADVLFNESLATGDKTHRAARDASRAQYRQDLEDLKSFLEKAGISSERIDQVFKGMEAQELKSLSEGQGAIAEAFDEFLFGNVLDNEKVRNFIEGRLAFVGEELESQLTEMVPTAAVGDGDSTTTKPQGPSTELISAREAFKKLLEDTISPAQELDKAFADLALVEASLGDASGDAANDIQRVRVMLNGMRDDLEEGALDEQFSGLKSVVEGTVEPFQKLQDQLNALQALINEGDAAVLSYLFGTNDKEAIAEVMGRITGQIEELREKGEEAAETFSQTMAPAIASLAHTFTNDFVNSLLSGRDALESFKNFAKNIVSQIIATFLQMAVVNQILNAVFSSIPGFQAQPTMSFGGGGGVGSGRSFAGGGALQGRTPYLVGERGPELFVPNTSGTIKTNADTKNKMGGDTFIVNQSLNFSTGVVPTVRAEIQKMLPQISDVTKTAVLESTRRGGTYRRGLLGA